MIALFGLSAIVLWQGYQLRQLKADRDSHKTSAAKLAEELKEARSQAAPTGSTDTGLNASERSELMRLRAEVTRLKQQGAATQKTSNASPARRVEPTQEEAAVVPSVKKVTADFSSKLSVGSTAIAGGWPTADGKRVFSLVTPSGVEQSEGAPPSIKLESKFVEIPESLVPFFIQSGVAYDSAAATYSGTLNSAQVKNIMELVEQTEGASLLVAPNMITTSGRIAQVSVTTAAVIENERIDLGPQIFFTPEVLPDGQIHLQGKADYTMLDR